MTRAQRRQQSRASRRKGAIPRWVHAILALSLLAVLAFGAWQVRGVFSREAAQTRELTSAPANPSGAPSSDSSPASPVPSAIAAQLRAIDALLEQRAQAISRKDRALFSATIADPSSTGGAALAAQFDALAALAPVDLRYAPASLVEDSATTSRAQGASSTLVIRSDVTYRLPDTDAGPARSTERFTVTRSDAGVRLLDAPVEGGDEHGIAPWSIPGVKIAKGPHGVVVGAVKQDQLERYAAMANAAVAQVKAVWQRPWPEKLAIVLPADEAQFHALVGGSRSEDYGQVAAMTLGPVDPDGRARADRIIVNPTTWADLSEAGRQFVLTHESTHVAVRASHPGRAPMWLTEGLADYVGYLPLGSTPAEVSPDLMKAVKEGRGPSALPRAADFSAADKPMAPTYAASWFAVRRLFEEFGKQTALGFFAASTAPIGAPGGEQPSEADAEAAADKAFKGVLRQSRERFTTDWLTALRQAADAR